MPKTNLGRYTVYVYCIYIYVFVFSVQIDIVRHFFPTFLIRFANVIFKDCVAYNHFITTHIRYLRLFVIFGSAKVTVKRMAYF